MTESATQTAQPSAPSGIKAKASDVGLKVYLKAPPKAQDAMLQGYLKTQPVAAKVKPHWKKVAAAVAALLVVRKVRRRRHTSRADAR